MQLPSREGLTTPRSARAPVCRRPTGTLPHQRVKKESKEVPTGIILRLLGLLPTVEIS